MKRWNPVLGIFVLFLIAYGCATKKPVPLPETISPPPEFVEVDIQPEPAEIKPLALKPIIAKVTSYRLNLRKTSSPKGRILGVLKKGDELVVQMKKGKWVNVHARNGLQGWVSSRYIKSADEMPIDDALATLTSEGVSKPILKTVPTVKKRGIGANAKRSDDKNSGKIKGTQKRPKTGNHAAVFKTPINKAIEKMLRKTGDDEILKSVTSISSNNLGGFAIATIHYRKNGKKTRIKTYLLRLKGRWVAYKKIPTRLDHPGVFWMLAQTHCKKTYRSFHGMGYGDGYGKKSDPHQRNIQFICSELIGKQYKDHRLRFTFNLNKRNNWRVSEVLEVGADRTRKVVPNDTVNAKSISQLSLELASRKEKERRLGEVVERFFISILAGDMEAVKASLAAGMSPDVRRPRLDHSPLFTAVMGHQDNIAQLFIEKGGDVGFKAENGLTPLILAAGSCNSAPLVKALINAGADVNARANSGETPLMAAEGRQCNDIVGMLRRAGAI